jgi:hypothetical protein
MRVLIAVVLLLGTAGIAAAGPLDDALSGLIGDRIPYLLECFAVVSAILGVCSALVRDGSMPGGATVAKIVNILANNWGKAKNNPAEND